MADTVGERIKELREQRSMSQGELVRGLPVSASYVSLIETGRRRPRERVLETIAGRLGCTVEYLRTGRGGPGSEEVELRLRFAEMALRNGEPEAALAQFEEARSQALNLRYEQLALEASFGVARSQEARGDLAAAIKEFQRLADTAALPATISRGDLLIKLCRVHSFAGDLNRAVDMGEAALRLMDDQPLAATADESIELACTLAGCYYERGDLQQAQLLAERALHRAETTGSSPARAAAYWEAGMVASARGDLRGALKLVERALTLYSETDRVRYVGNLCMISAWLMLRLAPPDGVAAKARLQRAIELLTAQGNPIELAWAQTEMARCHLLLGEPLAALDLLAPALGGLGETHALEQARGAAVRGDAYVALDDQEKAHAAYVQAEGWLALARQNREVAAVWRELAEAFLGVGDYNRASDAFRRTADAAGIPDRSRPVRLVAGDKSKEEADGNRSPI